MRSLFGVPLAWCNLTQSRLRLLLSMLGIAFAVVLMFVQLGCRFALLDSNLQLIRVLDADLILVSTKQTTLAVREAFSRHRLVQARSVPGVALVKPLYLEYSLSQLRHLEPHENRRQQVRSIRVLGIDPEEPMLTIPQLDVHDSTAKVHQLLLPGRALVDSRARRENAEESVYGPLRPGLWSELANRQIEIVGTFELGSDFGTEGTLIVSSETFARWLRLPFTTGDPLAEVELGLIRLQPGADRTRVQQQLQAVLNEGDVMVLTRRELENLETNFWLQNTPIGAVFTFGLVMGVIVGGVISYQILSSDVSDRLAQYATLKAIGYSNSYLNAVVLLQAFILSVLGFLPGLVGSYGLYLLLARLTDLPMKMTIGRAGAILVLTVGMCMASGLLAVRKARKADPAEVF